MQAGIIQGNGEVAVEAEGECFLQNGLEKAFQMPVAAGKETILGTPVDVLQADSADGAREGTTTEGAQGAESEMNGAAQGALLGEGGEPAGSDVQPGAKEHRPPVFHYVK